MQWGIPKIWEDGRCYIIGGGASIIKQFEIPEDLVNQVIDKKKSIAEYSSYFYSLYNKHVIGVNMAYQLGDWIDIVFFGDKGFFLKNKESLGKLNNIRVGCVPYVKDIGWIKYVSKDKNKTKGISSTPNKIAWNGNSGGAAINLAYQLGAKQIILVGFDMNVDEKERQWWHQLYAKRDTEKGKRIFARHKDYFSHIAEDAHRLGVEIINANPDSAIDNFRKVHIKQIL